VVRLRIDESHARIQPELRNQLSHTRQFGVSVASTRSAHDEENRVGVVQCCQGADRDIEPFQRLDATDEQEHRVLEPAQAERGTSPAAVARREERMIDAGRDDLDAVGHRPVQALELRTLLAIRRQNHVAATDDIGFSARPAVGLGFEVLGLDAGKRVERRHEWQLELVLERVPGDARQPVVGMDQPRFADLAHPLEDAFGEFVDDLGQVVFLDDRRRAGYDMVDAEARFDADGRRQVGSRGTRVDIT